MSHARLSPSSAKRWMSCPASPNREAGLPDTDSPASMAGTNAHAYLEFLLAGQVQQWVGDGLPHKDATCSSMAFSLPYPEVPLTDELKQQAMDCYSYVMRRKKELKPATLRAESKLRPGIFTGRGDGDGTGDVLIVSDSVLEVVDLKTGGAFVDVNDPQLKIYGLGALADYADPTLYADPKFETIRLTIFQPRRPGKGVTERYLEMTMDELITWCDDEYIPKAAATDDPEAPAIPNEEACYFCKARSTCPEVSQSMTEHFGDLFMPTDTNTDGTGLNLLMASETVESLSPEALASIMDIAPLIKARLKDVEAAVNALLKDRKPVPGYKLVQGSGLRQWSAHVGMVEDKCRELKIPIAKFAPRTFVSPAQMQNLGLKVDKWEALQEFIEVKAGGLTLAPESDPRDNAVPQDPGFEPVTPEKPVTDDWLN